MVAVSGHYGVTVATCVPTDPESKGGSEATVRVAKADLVPTAANLRGNYANWQTRPREKRRQAQGIRPTAQRQRRS